MRSRRASRALAPFGRLVTYGLASREPVEVRNVDLMRTSRAVVGFWLMHLFGRPQELREGIAELLEAVAARELEVVIGDDLPAVGGAPRPRGHRRAANTRQAAPGPESVTAVSQ